MPAGAEEGWNMAWWHYHWPAANTALHGQQQRREKRAWRLIDWQQAKVLRVTSRTARVRLTPGDRVPEHERLATRCGRTSAFTWLPL